MTEKDLKTRRINLEYNFCVPNGNLEGIIEELQCLKEKYEAVGITNLQLQLHIEDDGYSYHTVTGVRLETDKEYQERIEEAEENKEALKRKLAEVEKIREELLEELKSS